MRHLGCLVSGVWKLPRCLDCETQETQATRCHKSLHVSTDENKDPDFERFAKIKLIK